MDEQQDARLNRDPGVTTTARGNAETARNILDLINRFNLETRQTQATAERVFVEERVLLIEG
ncbi:hypothetical protein ACFL6T_07350 [Candidatus Zixiibacteriota bacterium]